MTSPPSPPNRRRRRVVVTIAVLVLGLVWFWPRVDQRFVGKWRTPQGAVIDLQDNGFADEFHVTNFGGSLRVHQPVKWRVRGGRFEVVSYDKTLRTWLLNSYHRWRRGPKKDERVFEGRVHFDAEVVEVADNHFVVEDGWQTYLYLRVTN